MNTRRELIKGGLGLAGIIAAQKSPAFVKSLIAASNTSLLASNAGLTTRDYVQDGLIIQFDAIENYAYREHRDLTDRWYDIISGGYCSSSHTAYQPLSWHDGYVESLGTGGFNLNASTVMISSDVSDYTIEYIASEHTYNGENTPIFPNRASCGYSFNSSKFGNYFSFGVKNATTNNPSGNGNKYSTSELQNCKSLVVVNQSGHGRYIVDYMYDKQCETDMMGVASEQLFIVGGSYRYNFKFHAVRMYRRALTNEELEHNWEIDKARFNLPD